MNPEPHRLVTRTGSGLQWAYAHASCDDAGKVYAEIAMNIERCDMEAVAVEYLATRRVLVDALEVLLPSSSWSAQIRSERCGERRVGMSSDDWRSSAYAGRQRWTRDPRGSRVQSYSPRIPHGKVTKWQSISIRPCQGAIIG